MMVKSLIETELDDAIRVRFKVRKRKGEIKNDVSSFSFVGFVRGLQKAGTIWILPTIEKESTEEYYVVDIVMEKELFEMVKGQANSYGIHVEQVDEYGHELNTGMRG